MDTHLNIFRFFNADKKEFLEDNLSRGFALCLKYDSIFLDRVLQKVLSPDKYGELFNTEFPDYRIDIDLQTRASDLEDFKTIVGVACSGIDVGNVEAAIARETLSPETDVCIRVKDICILFEFKRTSEDCRAQLKRQVERIEENCGGDVKKEYINLDWKKIIDILTSVSSFQKQIPNENPFTADFLRFLETFNTDWFSLTRLLNNIPFSSDIASPNYRFLNNRLDQIKKQVFRDDKVIEKEGKYKRLAIKVDYGWINEINSGPVNRNNQNFIDIGMHFGDTKEQGRHFFNRRPNGIEWQNQILGYEIEVQPYLKISNAYGSALLWIGPTIEESGNTHTKQFFDKFAGKKRREEWNDFERDLSGYIADWKNKCSVRNEIVSNSWDDELTNTQRTSFSLSVGTYLRIFVPYTECQALDDNLENPKIALRFREIIEEVKNMIDGPLANIPV